MAALCFATNNPHKLREIREMLSGNWIILSLDDIGCRLELPETGDTLESNSLEKARFVYAQYRCDCFADDTGLEVEALDGAPGVYSARYAGPGRNSHENVLRLLKDLKNHANRRARFRTVITLIQNDSTIQFEGIAEGKIIRGPKGDRGFGYDPVFIPYGYDMTFAELSATEKNKISHRGRALRKLVDYLQTNMQKDP